MFDLSPLEVKEVERGGLRLRFKEAVLLQPRLDDDNPQFVSIEDLSLGVHVFATTIDELIDEVAEDLVVVWREYAKASDADLSPKALELKHRLLAVMEEVPVESGRPLAQ